VCLLEREDGCSGGDHDSDEILSQLSNEALCVCVCSPSYYNWESQRKVPVVKVLCADVDSVVHFSISLALVST
jgi:hypothetical protein